MKRLRAAIAAARHGIVAAVEEYREIRDAQEWDGRVFPPVGMPAKWEGRVIGSGPLWYGPQRIMGTIKSVNPDGTVTVQMGSEPVTSTDPEP